MEDEGYELLGEAIRKWSEENESAILEEVKEAASWTVEAPGSVEYSIEDGRSFVMFYTNFASDDYVMYVYEVTSGKLEKTDEVNALYFGDGVINTQIMELSKNLDVLGSYCTCMDYALDENGKLVAQEGLYEIPATSYEWHKLTTTKDLPLQINGEERVLPIRTKLRITATDNAGKAWFRVLDSGEEGVINYTNGNGEDTWGFYIDGIQDMEYFEMVPYAG